MGHLRVENNVCITISCVNNYSIHIVSIHKADTVETFTKNLNEKPICVTDVNTMKLKAKEAVLSVNCKKNYDNHLNRALSNVSKYHKK